jgi:hypothetical protein
MNAFRPARRAERSRAVACASWTALLGAVLALASVRPASAEACKIDEAPAATLLLPYFEVDLNDPAGANTLFSIGNAVSAATLVNVTLWTDWGVPTAAFPVYLTGWDVETLSVRDLLAGKFPRTASDGQDPNDTISPQGSFSQDINLSSCNGILPLPETPDPALVNHLRLAHTGKGSPGFAGNCSGRPLNDGKARGFVTVDVVNGCSATAVYPSDAGYFGAGGRASSANVLFGDFFFVDSRQNNARGGQLVRLEAFPGRFSPGQQTFYGRFSYGGLQNYQAVDDREPLAPTWAMRYLQGGVFDGGASFLVWRDPGVPTSAVTCGTEPHAATGEATIVFDEDEDAVVPQSCPILCPPVPTPRNIVGVTQRVAVDEIDVFGGFAGLIPVPYPYGWMMVQFGHSLTGIPAPAQSWVGVELEAGGRFSIGSVATPLDSGCGPTALFPDFAN